MKYEIEISGKNEYEMCVKYLSLIKGELHITRPSELKVLAMLICYINQLFREGIVKNKKELQDYMDTAFLKEIPDRYDKKKPIHTFSSTTYTLRKTREVIVGFDEI